MTTLKAGAARAVISPSADLFPMRTMVGEFGAVKEHEDIKVRALVLDNGERRFLFESFELGGVPCAAELRAQLEARFGLRQEDVLLTATHNHSAPFVVGKNAPFEVPEGLSRYSDFVLEQAIRVVGEAIAALRPARFGFGEGQSFINVNRDQLYDDGYWMQGANWEGCSDKTLAALKFVDEEGRLIAAVLNYAMHANVAFCAQDLDGLVKVTCDAPGIACDFAEERFGDGAVVLWQSGAAGNQNPTYIGIKHVCDPDGHMRARLRQPGAAYEQCDYLGLQHGLDIVRTLNAIDADSASLRITTVDDTLFFPTQRFPVDRFNPGHHRLVVDNLLEFGGVIGPDEPQPPKVLADMIPCDEKAPMKAQLILLGDVALFGVACELYNEIGVLCKEAAPFKHTLVTTHIGEPGVGYVLDDASKGHKVFQSFGLVREGESNAIVVNGMLDMFKKALNG